MQTTAPVAAAAAGSAGATAAAAGAGAAGRGGGLGREATIMAPLPPPAAEPASAGAIFGGGET